MRVRRGRRRSTVVSSGNPLQAAPRCPDRSTRPSPGPMSPVPAAWAPARKRTRMPWRGPVARSRGEVESAAPRRTTRRGPGTSRRRGAGRKVRPGARAQS
ncbi:Hypothetical protein A7982_11836 [Minicystis rosea]|nr:Hypothetical protein A7982_11836 [Minicystis rosea]